MQRCADEERAGHRQSGKQVRGELAPAAAVPLARQVEILDALGLGVSEGAHVNEPVAPAASSPWLSPGEKAGSFSAARRRALRERGLSATSAGDGTIGRRVRIF